MQMSDGTMYKSVFVQSRGVMKKKVGRTPANVSQNGIEVETVLGRALKKRPPQYHIIHRRCALANSVRA